MVTSMQPAYDSRLGDLGRRRLECGINHLLFNSSAVGTSIQPAYDSLLGDLGRRRPEIGPLVRYPLQIVKLNDDCVAAESGC